ncbi:hypothetical protein [Gaiella sp.]|jgi:hypothetical protein|uniref:hypothetical protein n=1 Tax=Gaiella sp. TaxID=2663207 RepID=UPI002E314000|nr:hypothetical protein [Gaiella sp.]HEX5585045.1 hypothetical protein [Gaiella sp.]
MDRLLRGGLRVKLVALVAAGVAALVVSGSALAGDHAPLPRVGYCLDGDFVNLALGQPKVDLTYEGAVLANYVAGVGLTCKAPPAGYVTVTTAPDEFGVPGRLYLYWQAPDTVS